jgi:hypothetical protein
MLQCSKASLCDLKATLSYQYADRRMNSWQKHEELPCVPCMPDMLSARIALHTRQDYLAV